MANQKKKTTTETSESSDYTGVGIAFFTIGLALLVSETTRYAGLPFFILGLSFLAIAQQNSKKSKNNKHKK